MTHFKLLFVLYSVYHPSRCCDGVSIDYLSRFLHNYQEFGISFLLLITPGYAMGNGIVNDNNIMIHILSSGSFCLSHLFVRFDEDIRIQS